MYDALSHRVGVPFVLVAFVSYTAEDLHTGALLQHVSGFMSCDGQRRRSCKCDMLAYRQSGGPCSERLSRGHRINVCGHA